MTAVVSLTFDDALPEHLDFVAPLLQERGFRATFYVHLSSPVLSGRAREWAALTEDGHELGNHTVFHPADGRKSWVTAANASDDYTLDRIQAELELANQWLQSLDGQQQRSFAYPCSSSVIGRAGLFRRMIRNTRLERTRVAGWLDAFSGPGETRQTYRSVAAKMFSACRSGGLTLKDRIPRRTLFERDLLPSASVHDCAADTVKQFVVRGLEADTWPILQFHGIGGDHGQNCDPTVFTEILNWLKTIDVTVDTVSAVARQIWDQDSRSDKVEAR